MSPSHAHLQTCAAFGSPTPLFRGLIWEYNAASKPRSGSAAPTWSCSRSPSNFSRQPAWWWIQKAHRTVNDWGRPCVSTTEDRLHVNRQHREEGLRTQDSAKCRGQSTCSKCFAEWDNTNISNILAEYYISNRNDLLLCLLSQRSASIFCKGPENKYFRPCGSWGLPWDYLTLLSRGKAVLDNR